MTKDEAISVLRFAVRDLFPPLVTLERRGSWRIFDGSDRLVAVVGDWSTLERLIGSRCFRYYWQWEPETREPP